MNSAYIVATTLFVVTANFDNVWSRPRRTFEFTQPSRNGVKTFTSRPTASTTTIVGNHQPIEIGNIDSNGVHIGSPNDPVRISNGEVWIRGKMVYRMPPDTVFSLTGKHILVDDVPVVDIATGKVLVPNQKQNVTAQTSSIKQPYSDDRIPYAKPDTVIEGANGQIKVDGVVVLNDPNFKTRGMVDFYVKNGKMFFNGNAILRDDPSANFKMHNVSAKSIDLFSFKANLRNGRPSFRV